MSSPKLQCSICFYHDGTMLTLFYIQSASNFPPQLLDALKMLMKDASQPETRKAIVSSALLVQWVVIGPILAITCARDLGCVRCVPNLFQRS